MRRFSRLAVVAASAFMAASCSESPAGSGAGGSATIGLMPSFSASASQAYAALAAFGIDITNVHVRLTAPDGSMRDTTISFPVEMDTLSIEIAVPLLTAGESFRADIELRSADGLVLFSGTQHVVARATRLLGERGGAIVQILYTGPGSTVKTVTVSPASPGLSGVSTVAVTASGADAAGAVVSNVLVNWSTSDPTIATVVGTGISTATVTSTGKRGSATITAKTPLNVSGTAVVAVTPVAAKIAVISGGGQTGAAGTTLPQPLVVELQAADNLPVVGGGSVAFRAVTAGGSVTTASVLTDPSGRASTTLKLGPTAGAYVFEASSGSLTPATVSETATPAPAAALTINSGDGQSATVATALPLPITVKVLDQFGAPAVNAAVQWTRTSGGGAVGSPSTSTDASGIASNTYTFGNVAGDETIRASLPGLTGPNANVVFTVHGTAGAPVAMTTSGSNQKGPVGTALPNPFITRVVDAFGNGVAGVPVVWTVTGNSNVTASFAPPVSTTDVGGFAQTTVTLGNTVGPLQVTAVVSSALTVNYFAIVEPGQGATPGAISGLVYDGVNNAPLGGVKVTITSSGQAGGSVTVQTATDGHYITSPFPGGVYDVQVSLPGYVTTTILGLIVNGTTVAPAVPLVPASTSPGGISGTIISATTNQALTTTVTVELRSGLNALTGTPIQSVQTNGLGQYVFATVSAGTYTVLATAPGYAAASKTGISVGATTTGNQNVFISPLTAVGAVRIVLTWRTTPRDLDSHLTGPTGTDTLHRFHVYYSNRGNCNASPFACLDQDVTSGSGPETMTISTVFNGRYRYGIQNYTCCGNGGSSVDLGLSQSGAKVEVYISNTLVQSFSVPAGAGNFWQVFDLNGSTITPINQIVTLGAFGGAITRIPNGNTPLPRTVDENTRILNDVRAHQKSTRSPQ
ncbi:MAG: Ig-like domain-containing protein [bacterium]